MDLIYIVLAILAGVCAPVQAGICSQLRLRTVHPALAALISFAVGTRDGDRGIAAIYESTQWVPKSFNLSFYANDAVDEALQTARVETDQEERLRLYGEAGKQIMEDAPALFLVSYEFVGAYSNRVHGAKLDPNGGVRVTHAWIEQ